MARNAQPTGATPRLESPPRHGERWRPWLIPIAFTVWLVLAVSGMAALWDYSSRPGVAGTPPAQWPAGSVLARSTRQFTLVMFVHPICPCTRASIGELAILMAHAGGRLRSYLVFERPGPGLPARWERTDLWESAAKIPGVTVVVDNRNEARRFGSATSGQIAIYDAGGRLRFNGGITAARGHWGDSPGLFEINALLRGGDRRHGRAPVFGCPLFGDHDKNPVMANLTCPR